MQILTRYSPTWIWIQLNEDMLSSEYWYELKCTSFATMYKCWSEIQLNPIRSARMIYTKHHYKQTISLWWTEDVFQCSRMFSHSLEELQYPFISRNLMNCYFIRIKFKLLVFSLKLRGFCLITRGTRKRLQLSWICQW